MCILADESKRTKLHPCHNDMMTQASPTLVTYYTIERLSERLCHRIVAVSCIRFVS